MVDYNTSKLYTSKCTNSIIRKIIEGNTKKLPDDYNENTDNNDVTKNLIIIDNSDEDQNSSELSKSDIKHKAKSLVKKKFKIGSVYMLRQKSICGSKEIIKKYVLKKFIYSSNDQILNVLIMKQIDGPKGAIFTLNRNDCKRYHIKYEPGLQVFSMEFNWIQCKY